MTDAVRHRGPDDEGYVAIRFADRTVVPLAGPDSRVHLPAIQDYAPPADLYMGHRRLSILDLSPQGHQPMAGADRQAWVVYNGELFNYRELREKLKAYGHEFVSDSDTEVLLAAYRQWGEGLLDRLDGMWSFVLYDRQRHVLFGSRDRLGVKSLYYHFDGRHFVFASELKALRNIPVVSPALNIATIRDYLLTGRDHYAGDTFFQDVRELAAGSAFTLDLDSRRLDARSYYSLKWNDAAEPWRPEADREHIRQVREGTESAIRSHLIADVPIGSCLSGGLDSSAIVGLVSRMLQREDWSQVGPSLQTFTAVYPGLEIDESDRAQAMALASGSRWHPVEPEAGGMLRDLEDLVHCQDMPFGSTSIYAQYCVMRRAHETGITVLLDGQGADELFGGYARFFAPFWRDLWRHRQWGGLLHELAHVRNSPLCHKEHLASIRRNIASRLGLGGRASRSLAPARYMAPGLLGASEGAARRPEEPESLNAMLAACMGVTSLPGLLRYEDCNSMRFSIEARTPFADDRALIEQVFSIPSAYKIRDGRTKHLLRQAVQGVVPETIRTWTNKIGFATPECDWLRNNRQPLEQYLTPDLNPFMEVDALRRDWETLVDRQERGGGGFLWRFVNLAIWMSVFRLRA